MNQYEQLCSRILHEGTLVENKRTGKRVLTVINADLTYHVDRGEFPLVTTRKCAWRSAIAEMLGYLRGVRSAADFAALGTKTWYANANDNESWLANKYREGQDDMGRVYGVQLRDWKKPDGTSVDQLMNVYQKLMDRNDDRGLILQMWNPGEFDQMCLRPCMYEHQFSILDDTLYLNSTQRSCDVPLGLTFNMVQCYFLLAIMAHVTGLKPGKAYHKIINAHIYEDQIDLMKEQVNRLPFPSPLFRINPLVKSLDDVLTWVFPEDFYVDNYQHHPPIKYPFSV